MAQFLLVFFLSFFFSSRFLSGKVELQQQSNIARDDMFNVIDSSLILIRRT